jgi:general secretion pathway protein E
MAQRLVRRVCHDCAVPYHPLAEELAEIGIQRVEGGMITAGFENPVSGALLKSRAGGCEACLGTGYRGRAGIYELLPVGEELRELVVKNATATEIKNAGGRVGMLTLRQDGARKVLARLTTIDEILRVTQDDVEVEI